MKPPRPFDPHELQSLPVVSMVSAGAPIDADQIHRVWRAMVQTPGSVQPALPVALKYMPSSVKLAIELACSLASAVLRLPVPRGMIVLAHPDELPGLPADVHRLPGRPEVMLYGSMLQWPDDTAERALQSDPAIDDFIWRRFCETTTAAPAASWDELVANADRHVRNFIFDGTRYWLIDHELALRPLADAIQRLADAATRQSIIDHRARDNQVAQQMLKRRPNDHGILSQPREFEGRVKALKGLAACMDGWVTGIAPLDSVLKDARVVMDGIIMRLPALALQLHARLHLPTAPLLWTPSTDSSSPA